MTGSPSMPTGRRTPHQSSGNEVANSDTTASSVRIQYVEGSPLAGETPEPPPNTPRGRIAAVVAGLVIVSGVFVLWANGRGDTQPAATDSAPVVALDQPTPTTATPNPTLGGTPVPPGNIAGRLLTTDSRHFGWTNDGDVVRSPDGVRWERDDLLSNPNVRVFGLFEQGDDILMVGTWEFQQGDLIAATFRLGPARLAPDGSAIESSGFKVDRDRPQVNLGPRSTTEVLFTAAADTTVIAVNEDDVPVVHLSSPEAAHRIVLRTTNRPRDASFLDDAVLIRVQDGGIEIDPETGSVTVLMSLSFARETRPS